MGLQAQQHSFNCPFQLASQKRYPEANSPDDADVYEVSLLPGDILVLGSDGLFDNMWDSQLETIIREHLQAQPFSASCHSCCNLHVCLLQAFIHLQ